MGVPGSLAFEWMSCHNRPVRELWILAPLTSLRVPLPESISRGRTLPIGLWPRVLSSTDCLGRPDPLWLPRCTWVPPTWTHEHTQGPSLQSHWASEQTPGGGVSVFLSPSDTAGRHPGFNTTVTTFPRRGSQRHGQTKRLCYLGLCLLPACGNVWNISDKGLQVTRNRPVSGTRVCGLGPSGHPQPIPASSLDKGPRQ